MHHYESCVAREWVDYNGHLRDAFYAVVFSSGIDALMDAIGVDEAYRQRTKGTLYTLEMHLFFLKEVKEGAPLRVGNRVLDVDNKRLHLHQTMYHGGTGDLLSVQESMLLHVSQEGEPHAAAFPADILARVMAMQTAQTSLPAPDKRAGAIAIRRKS